mmetsp:Transcript_71707/g.192432  ORF Transcript_71707/g.192432 Transcript_71707/m.192432 type:complete len:237 (-) Transcript_71707:1313-2023(-)
MRSTSKFSRSVTAFTGNLFNAVTYASAYLQHARMIAGGILSLVFIKSAASTTNSDAQDVDSMVPWCTQRVHSAPSHITMGESIASNSMFSDCSLMELKEKRWSSLTLGLIVAELWDWRSAASTSTNDEASLLTDGLADGTLREFWDGVLFTEWPLSSSQMGWWEYFSWPSRRTYMAGRSGISPALKSTSSSVRSMGEIAWWHIFCMILTCLSCSLLKKGCPTCRPHAPDSGRQYIS